MAHRDERRPRAGTMLAPAVIAFALTALPLLADETILLDDPGFAGRWRVDPWAKAPGGLTLRGDGPEGVAPSGSLTVTIDWPTDDEFRFFSVAPRASRGPIPYHLRALSLWVKPPGDRHVLEVHLTDAEGAEQKLGFGALPTGDWRELGQAIPADWVQPLTLKSITWHNWGLQGVGGRSETGLGPITGVIDPSRPLADDTGTPELWLGTPAAHGTATPDGTCEVALRVLTWRPTDRTVELLRELQDNRGVRLSRTTDQVQLTDGYSASGPVDLPRHGSYRYSVIVDEGDRPAVRGEIHLASLPVVPPLTEAERAASYIGVNTHVGAPWEAFERLGIHWARDYSWGWLKHGETAPVGNGRDFGTVL